MDDISLAFESMEPILTLRSCDGRRGWLAPGTIECFGDIVNGEGGVPMDLGRSPPDDEVGEMNGFGLLNMPLPEFASKTCRGEPSSGARVPSSLAKLLVWCSASARPISPGATGDIPESVDGRAAAFATFGSTMPSMSSKSMLSWNSWPSSSSSLPSCNGEYEPSPPSDLKLSWRLAPAGALFVDDMLWFRSEDAVVDTDIREGPNVSARDGGAKSGCAEAPAVLGPVRLLSKLPRNPPFFFSCWLVRLVLDPIAAWLLKRVTRCGGAW